MNLIAGFGATQLKTGTVTAILSERCIGCAVQFIRVCIADVFQRHFRQITNELNRRITFFIIVIVVDGVLFCLVIIIVVFVTFLAERFAKFGFTLFIITVITVVGFNFVFTVINVNGKLNGIAEIPFVIQTDKGQVSHCLVRAGVNGVAAFMRNEIYRDRSVTNQVVVGKRQC